jgi:hypothetical protein
MKAKKVARNRRRTASRPTERSERQKTVKVRLGRLGSDVQDLELPIGTTVKDLVKSQGLGTLSIRINQNPVRLGAELRDGDTVVVTPRHLAGGAGGRHDHLDLDEYRRTMSPADFAFFVNFVGADALGFSHRGCRLRWCAPARGAASHSREILNRGQ